MTYIACKFSRFSGKLVKIVFILFEKYWKIYFFRFKALISIKCHEKYAYMEDKMKVNIAKLSGWISGEKLIINCCITKAEI